ncbi:MAG TPA: MmgE/PrpD family protein [Solirubrobacteraceae bacterium]|nr:MmgE/PrpD family protein [Solirubrobacteraceae bacterium]
MIAISSDQALCDFVAGFELRDLPDDARARLSLLTADMAAVCVSGRAAPASRIAADHAVELYGPAHPDATLLLDGRRAGVIGAAFANGVLANALDFDDGHRLTKGHPGAIVIPAALAVAQRVDATARELLEAIVVGYEIAIRAGIALHERDDSYHASGAWGAVGAAAAASRLLGLDPAATVAALGLAEYHGPIAHIMRSCAAPRMTKDACSWGAAVGVESALLAARGFTSVRGEFMDAVEVLDDLRARWRLQELYIKPYPCCRWSQCGIAAALAATGGRTLDPGEVRRVTARTFAAADGLAKAIPESTEEAQYSLVWPLASALTHGRFGVDEVLGPFTDGSVRAMFELIDVEIDPELTAAFPARRLTAVEIELLSGELLAAGPLESFGEPDDPGLSALVAAKVRDAFGDAPVAAGFDGGVRDASPDELLALLRGAVVADG